MSRFDAPGAQSSVRAELQTSTDIDAVVSPRAPGAAVSVKAKEVGFAVDQHPYQQGHLAVDELWPYKTNGNVRGGGKPVLTGPAIVTERDAPELEKHTAHGTR